jgi:hypothetical protein
MMFRNSDRVLLRAILVGVEKMALDFSKMQASVAALNTDVTRLLADFAAGQAPAQATIDAVTKSLSDLDAAVNTADPAPISGATGATGTG